MNKNRLRDPWPRRRDANRDRDTGHVDIGPGGRIGVAAEVIVLLQIGLVAVGALVIPSLVAPSPVQRATRLELLIGVEMKPAFAAFFFRAAVPCDAERLITPSGKGNQVLLQRIYLEGVGDPVIVRCAIGALGAHHKFIARAPESSGDAEVLSGPAWMRISCTWLRGRRWQTQRMTSSLVTFAQQR